MSIFVELALVLTVVVVISFFMKVLRQPLVIGYILAGIVVGPLFFNIVSAHDTLELFSKIGITILLFIVGLHLNPMVIKEVGKVSIITGIGQVLFTTLSGFLIALLLGLTTIAAMYVGIALTFSSTIIILKLLSDKGHTQTLYGKIAVGLLIVQDVVASIILIAVSAFSGTADTSFIPGISLLIMKGLGLILLLYLAIQWILPKLTYLASQNQELLFVFSLTWGLIMAAVFQWLGLSTEIGALVAGVSFSALPYAEEISSKLRPLRDFFVILFFINLGSMMVFDTIISLLLPVVVLSLFVLIGNPVIVVILMNILGYHKKTSFMTGLTVAQISEFSLILASLGLKMGHLSQETVTLITLVGVITIALSTYMILFSEKIYPKVEQLLSLLELRKNLTQQKDSVERIQVLLFGCDRTSDIFIKLAEKLGYTIGIVDFNPEAVAKYKDKNVHLFYGDASNFEFLDELPLRNIRLVISSIPSLETNLLLSKHLRKIKKSVMLIVFGSTTAEAEKLYESGVNYVVLPHEHAAHRIAKQIVKSGFDSRALRRHLAVAT